MSVDPGSRSQRPGQIEDSPQRLAFLCRVHSASKMARAHERVSLTDESETSMCDICQVGLAAHTSPTIAKQPHICICHVAALLCTVRC